MVESSGPVPPTPHDKVRQGAKDAPTAKAGGGAPDDTWMRENYFKGMPMSESDWKKFMKALLSYVSHAMSKMYDREKKMIQKLKPGHEDDD